MDSSEIAFRLAGIHAFKEAAEKADPVILEPIMKVVVTTPVEFVGDVSGSISSKRGQIENTVDSNETDRIITAQVPLKEMFGYTTNLRSMTKGQAGMVMEFDHYEVVPGNVAAEIKAQRA